MNFYTILNILLTLINIGLFYAMKWYIDKSTETSIMLLKALKENKDKNT